MTGQLAHTFDLSHRISLQSYYIELPKKFIEKFKSKVGSHMIYQIKHYLKKPLQQLILFNLSEGKACISNQLFTSSSRSKRKLHGHSYIEYLDSLQLKIQTSRQYLLIVLCGRTSLRSRKRKCFRTYLCLFNSASKALCFAASFGFASASAINRSKRFSCRQNGHQLYQSITISITF